MQSWLLPTGHSLAVHGSRAQDLGLRSEGRLRGWEQNLPSGFRGLVGAREMKEVRGRGGAGRVCVCLCEYAFSVIMSGFMSV